MKEQHDILTGMLNCTEAASILLAMTTSLADENALKELLQKQGYKFAVTETRLQICCYGTWRRCI